ncbi:hypothetical protein [Dehalobacter sp. TeCB1]|uniref:hypothetical protein n=1 Tax=Dehalobacter sp. TeCB1 TaxID=1843715 RepID=UPI0009F3339B|nr:hypothetical protein [Dehalobacter sp. TeCB1]
MDNNYLTTLVSYPDRGQWGNNKWRGNFSGKLVEDLINWYHPKRVYDPMCGSGTTIDVCNTLGVDCMVTDLNPKFGGWDALTDEVPGSSDFTIFHPPYHDMIQYSGNVWGEKPDIRDLSRCSSYQEFIQKINTIQLKLFRALRKGGRLIILVGDYKKQGRLFSIQKDMDWLGTPEQVIIKTQHNAESFRKKYAGKFIPIVHEYLLVFRRDDCYLLPVSVTKTFDADSREQKNQTWRDVVHAALEKLGGKATLSALYNEVQGHSKCSVNVFWREKVRQVLQIYKDFTNDEKGKWSFSY